MRIAQHASFLAIALATSVHAQVTVPNDFETPTSRLLPAFSYFGGVQSYSTAVVPVPVYSGSSLAVSINFRHDNFFPVAGVGVGTGVLAPPALGARAGATLLSITAQGPTTGMLTMKVAVREDDNGDGVIDLGGDDDEWETRNILLTPTATAYNLAFSAFEDTDPDSGDNVRNFTSTGRMALVLTFETRTTLPGGIIETPVTVRIDHLGFFAAPQSIPGPACTVDFNHDGLLEPGDLDDFITAFFAGEAGSATDFNADGLSTPDDLDDFITAYFEGCA
ncbi:MAG: hypothetical protein ACT4PL_05665 [Phycisphaerales bacterium]